MFTINKFVEELEEKGAAPECQEWSADDYSSIFYASILPPDEVLMRKEDALMDDGKIWDRKYSQYIKKIIIEKDSVKILRSK